MSEVFMAKKIVGIDNSVWGKPMLITSDDLGNLGFELLQQGIVRFDIDRTTTASSVSDSTTTNS